MEVFITQSGKQVRYDTTTQNRIKSLELLCKYHGILNADKQQLNVTISVDIDNDEEDYIELSADDVKILNEGE